ncbi:MAG: 50S ribosomal protein L11 methyltransferase [Lachnospiraceae bacterium]|jgi:ribosomal protein L11 methyltransferase|nr:50S ribosomal protein L11 methyltransferase [Lachnospiraceae bacterium]
MRWNKYTLITTTEAEDLISSMMMDVGIEGIEIEDKVPLSEQDKSQMFVDILPEGPEDDGVARISFYLEPETDNAAVLAAVQKGLDEIRGWGIDVGAGTIEASQTEDKDWINNWKEYFHQFYVDDILIKPSWEEVQPKDRDKLLIQIDPGTAFGTGMHETTQLCIRQIRKYVTPETLLLDVGTGSGILSIAALKLGASYAFGTDLDPCAISAAVENREVNGIGEEQFQVMAGNIMEEETVKETAGYEKYHMVVANILAEVLLPLTPVVVKHMKKGGIYITSGIIEEKEDAVVNAVKEAGLELLEVTRQGEWVSVTARKN